MVDKSNEPAKSSIKDELNNKTSDKESDDLEGGPSAEWEQHFGHATPEKFDPPKVPK